MHSYSESVRILRGVSERGLPWDVPSTEGERALWSDDEQNTDCDEQPAERRHERGKSAGVVESKVSRPIAPVQPTLFLDPRDL